MCSINRPMLKNINSGDAIAVTGSPFAIGRGLSCDYIIISRVISRKHCVLEQNEDGWVLLDNSTNGTFINDQLFKGTRSNILQHNDIIILVQDYEYKFLTQPEENETNQLNIAESSKIESKSSETDQTKQAEIDKNDSKPNDADVKGHSSTYSDNIDIDLNDDFNVSKEISDEMLCNALDDVLKRAQVAESGILENTTSSSGNTTNFASAVENENSHGGASVAKKSLVKDISKTQNGKTREQLSDVSNIVDIKDAQRNLTKSPHSHNTDSSTIENSSKTSVASTSFFGTSNIQGEQIKVSATSNIVMLNQQNLQGAVSNSVTSSKAVVSPQNENKRVKVTASSSSRMVGTTCNTVLTCGTTLTTPQSSRPSQMTFTQVSPTVVQFPSSSSGTAKSYIRVQLTADQVKRLQSKGQIVTLPPSFTVNPNMVASTSTVNLPGVASASAVTLSSPIITLPNNGNILSTVIVNPTSTTVVPVCTVNLITTSTNATTTNSDITILSTTHTGSATSNTAFPAGTATTTTPNTTSTINSSVSTDTAIEPNTGPIALDVAHEVTIPYDGGVSNGLNDSKNVKSSLGPPMPLPMPERVERKSSSKRKSSTQKSKTQKLHTSQEATCSIQSTDDLKKCDDKLKDEVNHTEEMENELQCSICSELFVTAVTLTCSHSFCKYCIDTWKRTRSDCPICRKGFSAVTRTLVLDNVIDKIIESSSEDVKQQRKSLLSERQKLENPPPPPATRQTSRRGRSNRNRGERNNRNNNRNNGGNNTNQTSGRRNNGQNSSSNRNSHRDTGATTAPPPPPVVSEIVTVSSESSSDNSGPSDWEDEYQNDDWWADDYPIISIDMLMGGGYNGRRGAYYGGYGSCYRCGDPGHWANGCPYR